MKFGISPLFEALEGGSSSGYWIDLNASEIDVDAEDHIEQFVAELMSGMVKKKGNFLCGLSFIPIINILLSMPKVI